MATDPQHQKTNQDRITDLHDNLIHHILSHLPAKNAVATGILSTRWRYLWASIPNLQFHDTATKLTDNTVIQSHFPHFVRHVLHAHAGTIKCVNKFDLLITKKYNAVEITHWINHAITRNVRELVLDITATPLVLPRSTFTSQLLTVLKIDTEQRVCVPASIHFSGLKILHFGFVHVCVDDLATQVLIDCPVLERMSLIECEWVEINTVTILAPVLKELTVEDHPDGVDDMLYSCVVNFFTDSLGLFELKSNLPYVYSLNNLSSLVNANVHLRPNIPLNFQVVHRVEKLLRGIFNARSLTLSDRTIVSLSHADFLSHIATFSNLTHLTVNMEDYNDINKLMAFTIEHLMDLLCHLPEIDSLVFTNLHRCPLEEHSWTLETKKLSFLSRLKFVELRNFCGAETELCLVKFFLNNAKILKKFTVFIEGADSKEKIEIVEHLRMLEAHRELEK